MQWRDNEKEFDKLLKRMRALEKKKVDVGFFDTKYGEENNNLYVAQVAQWQEEGVSPNIMPRPFIRTGLHSAVTSPAYKKAFDKALDNVASKQETISSVCKRLGAGLQIELSQAIEDGHRYYPNSDEWAAFKQSTTGASSPLIYTGKMRDSVKYRIR